MVYNDVVDLGWWPYVDSWLSSKTAKPLLNALTGLFEKDLPQVLNFVLNNCNKLIPVSETNLVISLCRLFDGIYGDGSEVGLVDSIIHAKDGNDDNQQSIFSLTWRMQTLSLG